MKCQMSGCDGELGVQTFPMQTGCHSYTPSCACVKCGRIHSESGHLMFSRAGGAPYLVDGKVELILEPVELEVGKTYLTQAWMWVGIGDQEDVLEAGARLVFDRIEDESFCFHDADEVQYRLHRGDVNFIVVEE